MKLSKEELLARVNGLEIDDEVKIALMEDVDDSMATSENAIDEAVLESTKNELEDLKIKYEDLKLRYKERFLTGEEIAEEEEKDKDEEEDVDEVIDVTEI